MQECYKEVCEGYEINFLKLLVWFLLWFLLGDIWERRERKFYLFYLNSFNYLFSLFLIWYILGNLIFYLLYPIYFFCVLFLWHKFFLLWLDINLEFGTLRSLLLSCLDLRAIFYLLIYWKYRLAFWFMMLLLLNIIYL